MTEKFSHSALRDFKVVRRKPPEAPRAYYEILNAAGAVLEVKATEQAALGAAARRQIDLDKYRAAMTAREN